MKRILVIFMFLFVLVLSGISVDARSFVSDDYKENYYLEKKLYYHDGVEFNYLIQRSSDKYDDLLDLYYERFDDSTIEGDFHCNIVLLVTTSYGVTYDAEIRTDIRIINGIVSEIDYYFNDYLFYHFKISYLGSGDYYEFSGYDICDYYDEYVTCKALYYYQDESDLLIEYGDESLYGIYRFEYDNMLFLKYYEDNNNNEISVDYYNPMDIYDIVDSLGIRNNDDNMIGTYYILNTNYDLSDLIEGLYYINILGIDINGDLYYKRIYASVTKMDNPIKIKDFEINYTESIDKEFILNNTEVDIDYKNIIISSYYFDNKNICDNYKYTVSIETLDGRIISNTGNIKVIDNIKPEIVGPSSIQTDTENILTYDDILNRYKVTDEYSDINLRYYLKEMNSLDNLYINNYNLSGVYLFKIEAYDNYDNYNDKDIKLYVSHKKNDIIADNSTLSSTEVVSTNITGSNTISTSLVNSTSNIEVSTSLDVSVGEKKDEFKITTTINNKLSIENIKNELLDNSIIDKDEYDYVTIESDYFNNSNKSGSYLVSVRFKEGNEINFYIDVKEASNEVVSDIKNNKKDYIFYGVIGGLVLVIIVIIVISRRKKNGKKN